MILSRLNECWAERAIGLCSVDPITLTGLALGGLAGVGAGAASGAFKGGGSAPAPTPPPAQAAPPQAPQSKALPQSQQPTFLGAAATPPTQSGQKSLLGQ